MQADIRDAGSIPGLGRSPGGGQGNPLQCSCLENPRDGGSAGKESSLQCGRPGFHPWVGKIPWSRAWQPTPVFLPWRILMDREAWWATVYIQYRASYLDWQLVSYMQSHGCSPPGSYVHGILQARILEWVALPSSRGSPDRDRRVDSPAFSGRGSRPSRPWESLPSVFPAWTLS